MNTEFKDNASNTKPKTMKKKSVIAAILLGFFCPGSAQLYSGRFARGLFFSSMLLGIILMGIYSGIVWTFFGLVIMVISGYSLTFYGIFDAITYLKKSGTIEVTRWHFLLIYMVAFWTIAPSVVKFTPYKTYRITAGSMLPTIQIGDCFISNQAYFNKNIIERGDLIAYHDPLGSKKIYIKRVVGIGGDTIEMKNDTVNINGKPAEFTPDFFRADFTPPYEIRNVNKLIIPANHFYALGDNRYNSLDSRQYGPITNELIDSKPLYIYWSKNMKRIGKKL